MTRLAQMTTGGLPAIPDSRGKRYTDEDKEKAYILWKESGRVNSTVSKLLGIDRGTLQRWIAEGQWWPKSQLDDEAMTATEETEVTKSILEMNGPHASALIVGMIHGDVEPDKVRLDAAKTLLNRIGFPEMKIQEYVNRGHQEDFEVDAKPVKSMTTAEMVAEQKRLMEPSS